VLVYDGTPLSAVVCIFFFFFFFISASADLHIGCSETIANGVRWLCLIKIYDVVVWYRVK